MGFKEFTKEELDSFEKKMNHIVNLLEPEFSGNNDTISASNGKYIFYVARCENEMETKVLLRLFTEEDSPLLRQLAQVRLFGRDLGNNINPNQNNFSSPPGEA